MTNPRPVLPPSAKSHHPDLVVHTRNIARLFAAFGIPLPSVPPPDLSDDLLSHDFPVSAPSAVTRAAFFFSVHPIVYSLGTWALWCTRFFVIDRLDLDTAGTLGIIVFFVSRFLLNHATTEVQFFLIQSAFAEKKRLEIEELQEQLKEAAERAKQEEAKMKDAVLVCSEGTGLT